MKTKYSLEELKYNLPDYISNKIADKELIGAIEKELEINSELREDLEELKSTFGFLKTSKFQNPPNNYFANLPVKINERIQPTEANGSFLDRLSLVWKILLPAIPVIIIIAILLFNSSKKETNKIQISNIDTNKNELSQKKPEPVENKDVVNENDGSDTKEKTPLKEIVKKDDNIHKTFSKNQKNNIKDDPNKVEEQTNVKDQNNADQNNEGQNIIKENETVEIPEIKEQLGELLADNIEIIDDSNSDERIDVMYSGEDDESEVESLDDEFLNLTPEQQKEIIDNLIKTQILY